MEILKLSQPASTACHICQSCSSSLFHVHPVLFHGGMKRGCRDRREYKVNLALHLLIKVGIHYVPSGHSAGMLGFSKFSHGLSRYLRQAVGGVGGTVPRD